MDEIKFSDWPDPPGSNAWLPAYGYQQHDIMEKQEYFTNNCDSASNQALYLETIVEETSDDLRSERSSTSTWMSDSDADSVIQVGVVGSDCESGSEREYACPAKRRRHNDSDDSLSRSSSLAQFESLERSCAALSISPDSLDSTSAPGSDSSDSSSRTVRAPAPPPSRAHLSAENLSEDSGYSELRGRCKSDPSVRDDECRHPAPRTPRHTAARTEIARVASNVCGGGSVPCLASNDNARQTARAVSVPADLDLCIETKRTRRTTGHEQSFTQTFKVCERFTTSVADLTALDYRGSCGGQVRRPRVPPPPPPSQQPLQRESSTGSDSTTESEKAFVRELEINARRLDEAARLALGDDTTSERDLTDSVTSDNKQNKPNWGAWDDVLEELRRRRPPSAPISTSTSDASPETPDQHETQYFTSTPARASDERVRSTPELRTSTSRCRETPDDLRASLQHVASPPARPPGRSASSGSKGVTFSPVVSWREPSATESESARSESSSVDSRDAEVVVVVGRGESARYARETCVEASVTECCGDMQETGARPPRSRIAGFLSRFANFRFSSRKSEKKARNACVSARVPENVPVSSPGRGEVQSVRIPLKDSSTVSSVAVSGKPPRSPVCPAAAAPGVLETDVDTSRTVLHARSLLTLPGEPDRDRNRHHKSMEFLLDKDNARVVQPPENDLQKNSDRVLSEHELRVQRSLQKLNVPEWYKNAPPARESFILRKRLSDASAVNNRWSGLSSKTTSLGSLGGCQLTPNTTLNSSQLSPAATSFGRWSTSRLNSNQTSPCSSTRSSLRGGTISPLCSPSARSSFSARQPYLGWRASQERLLSTGTAPRTPHERLASSLLSQNNQQKASEDIQSSIKEVTSAIVHYVSGLEPANGDIEKPSSPRSNQKLWVESSFVGTKPLESPQTPTSVIPTGLPPVHPRPPSSLNLHRHAVTTPEWQASQKSLLSLTLTKPSPGSTTLEDVLDSLLGLPSSIPRAPSPQHSPRKLSSPYFMPKGPRYEPLTAYSNSSLASKTNYQSTPSEDGNLSSFRSTLSHTTDTSDSRDNLNIRRSSAESFTYTNLPSGKASVDSSSTINDMQNQKSRSKSTPRGEHTRRGSEPFNGSKQTSLDRRRTSLDVTKQNVQSPRYSTHGSKTSLHSVASLNTDNSIEEGTVKCKNSKCQAKTTTAEAKRYYKSCHNCNYMYCSNECRRAHWEKHRKACLHSRASALCRQILSSAKEDADCLHQISNIAYQGYLKKGRGVVKLSFTSPDAAEKFTTLGFQYMTQPVFLNWTNLLPTEMGAELYSEVVKLCKSYNPETKLILYVAVCILSEVPTKGAVKWERQMVSRCAKIKLSKSITSSIRSKTHYHTQKATRKRRDSKSDKENSGTDNCDTLVLTSKFSTSEEKDLKRFREVCFLNIQKELEKRGVLLKKNFPEVYGRLSLFVDSTVERFIPMTIYPKNSHTGKEFTCLIIPDTEVTDDCLDVQGNVCKIDVGIECCDQMSTHM